MRKLCIVSVVMSLVALGAWRPVAGEDKSAATQADKPGQPSAEPAAPPASTENTILDTASFWRFRTVMETPELRLPDGQTDHARVVVKTWAKKAPTDVEVQPANYAIERLPMVRLEGGTPP